MKKPKSILPRLAALEGDLAGELKRLALLRLQGKLPLSDGVNYRNGKGKKVNIQFKIDHFRSEIMDFSPDKCWEWRGHRDQKGYGRLHIKQVVLLAHRFSFAVFNGCESEAFLCHRCDNPSCVNPDHLFEGTQTDNMHDCSVKGRFGDRKGEANACRKLSNSEVLEIRASSLSGRVLAAQYGVSRSAVYQAKVGLTWSHVTP